MAAFSDLVGKTIITVNTSDEEIDFLIDTGEHYRMYHQQSWCEHVYVESIVGDLEDIIGSTVISAEEVTSQDTHPPELRAEALLLGKQLDASDCDFTWTFYKIGTAKGGVTIRWYGSSNGYSSETVNFDQMNTH